jgi:hypothetical protein
VPDEHDVPEVLGLDHGHDVLDVGCEIDRGRGEVRPLAEAGSGGSSSNDAVPSSTSGA